MEVENIFRQMRSKKNKLIKPTLGWVLWKIYGVRVGFLFSFFDSTCGEPPPVFANIEEKKSDKDCVLYFCQKKVWIKPWKYEIYRTQKSARNDTNARNKIIINKRFLEIGKTTTSSVFLQLRRELNIAESENSVQTRKCHKSRQKKSNDNL